MFRYCFCFTQNSCGRLLCAFSYIVHCTHLKTHLFYCVMICHHQSYNLLYEYQLFISKAFSRLWDEKNLMNLKFKNYKNWCKEIIDIHPPAVVTPAATATASTNSGEKYFKLFKNLNKYHSHQTYQTWHFSFRYIEVPVGHHVQLTITDFEVSLRHFSI